ncbi:MAG: hypothetical protein LBT95_04010 [Treponema sp.]|jgi:hypothetical protein|nr:hypothetical protein [Treponema sp.]
MENSIEIEPKIYTMPGLLPQQERIKSYSNILQQLSVEEIKKYYVPLLGDKKITVSNKKTLVKVLAEALIFTKEKEFREWFSRFPAITQKLLYRLAFDYLVPVKKLEEEFGTVLVEKSPGHSWPQKWFFKKELGIDLPIYTQYRQTLVALPLAVREILTPWLIPPPSLTLEACAVDGDVGPTWDNSAEIADSLPLLYDAITDFFLDERSSDSRYKNIRGFKKKDAEGLRASSAFKPFPVLDSQDAEGQTADQKRGRKAAARASGGNDVKVQELVPDSADLTARFILAMKNFSIVRPEDGQKEVKALVKAFFDEESQYKDYLNPSDRHSLEYNVLFDHITKGNEYYLKYEGSLPASRKSFREILMSCAKDGRAFDADKIARRISRTFQPFFFYFSNIERSLRYRADTITVEGLEFSLEYYDSFEPKGIMEYYLLIAPVFKAYCYLFAALGILEITQAMPPLARMQNEKLKPLSPYDSLKTFRVTEFGKWCLDLTKKCPIRTVSEYQAIADKDLLLVTVQGNSLERTIYLDKIGRKLGSNRWRISPDSFIAGCTEKKHLEERISKFKALIDPEPAPHWFALFEKTLNRAGLFDYPLNGHLVYQLPADRNVAEELLRDPEFRSLVHRAEGGLLVVPEKNLKKFHAVLNAHGIVMLTRD